MQIDFSMVGDAELVARVRRLVRADRSVSAQLLVHLAELDARKLHLEKAYGSLHEYCVKALGMSDAEAYLRTQAARLGRKFPLVFDRVESGDLNLTSIKLIGPYLALANHVELLDRVRGKSKREVERLVAELAPQPDVPGRMRRLPEQRPLVAAGLTAELPRAQPSAASAAAEPAPAMVPTPAMAPAPAMAPTPGLVLEMPRPRASTKPLSPGRFKLELTLDQDGHDKLEQLQELLRHQIPNGDLARIVTLALARLHVETLKRRTGQLSKPRKKATLMAAAAVPATVAPDAFAEQPAGGSTAALLALEDHVIVQQGRGVDQAPDALVAPDARAAEAPKPTRAIPRAVRREVFARDDGRCTFVSDDGHRCEARVFIEVHHHNVTYARGGAATVENLRLACRAHNGLLAERDYGVSYMRGRASNAHSNRTTHQRAML
jgi:hypothetical protein